MNQAGPLKVLTANCIMPRTFRNTKIKDNTSLSYGCQMACSNNDNVFAIVSLCILLKSCCTLRSFSLFAYFQELLV